MITKILFICTLSIQLFAANAPSAKGPIVQRFKSTLTCPSFGFDKTDSTECNRLALDDEFSEAKISTNDRGQVVKIEISNNHKYSEKKVIASVAIRGIATTKNSNKYPLLTHLKISKKKNSFSHEVSVHYVTREDVTNYQVDPITVVLNDSSEKESITVNQDTFINAVIHPNPLKNWGAKLISVKEYKTDANLGFNFDIILGPASWGKKLVNTDLEIPKSEKAECHPSDLAQRNWSYKVTVLSNLVPNDVFKRELFLMGLSDSSIAKEVQESGLKKAQYLKWTNSNGVVELDFNGKKEKVENSKTLITNFFNFSFLGEIALYQSQCGK